MREKHLYMLQGEKKCINNLMNRVNLDFIFYDNLHLHIYADTAYYKEFLCEAKEAGVNLFLSRLEMEYTKYELETAKYLNLQMRTYCSNFPKEYGTIYSYDCKCKCCGSGKKQVSELFIDKTKMGKKDISLTYDFDVVVSQKLHNLFLENNITGVRFGSVRHKNDKMKNEPSLYQMLATNTLPPMSEKSVFYKENFCECCKKSGLLLNSLPHYSEEALKNAKDINYTYEYFGGGWSGSPYIIVSQKIYKLLRDNKIKGLVFDIVKIV